ncbi:penicillin-binding protein activator [Cereibacter changlensis]|uniref:Penicillin-binding protein activator n=1 Tax=Cereibacter changlensis TaxID=402884 RepID=A0A4U0YQY1_9RHOB|nr:penicillin-binding protein activator [Cereibacter changlensis]TKA94035.1 penicillin-binding protein activator [Cereibacter changlensis]
MLSLLGLARKSLSRVAIAITALTVAACEPVSTTGAGGPAIDTNAAVPVALLVPSGSGQASDELLARSLQNAARLAIADLGNVKVDLRVYNTSGQPAQAAAMASKAVDEGAKIILGPVYAQEANAAGAAVASRGVNVLSFSNNGDIAGGNVFVLGPTFQNTADRLSRYAVRQGTTRIMIVNDRDITGEIGRTAIQQAVGRAGGTVVASESYALSQNDIMSAAPGIAAQAKSSSAQAVFFTAASDKALPLVTQLLRDNGVAAETTRYIGLTRWDIPSAAATLPSLQGGWFALPDPGLYSQYQARYQTAYGEAPPPISALAYDGIAAIGALVKQGQSDALTGRRLTQGSGFVGVNGIFRLLGDGTNERGLAVAQIRNNQVAVIDPAPRSFGGAGF